MPGEGQSCAGKRLQLGHDGGRKRVGSDRGERISDEVDRLLGPAEVVERVGQRRGDPRSVVARVRLLCPRRWQPEMRGGTVVKTAENGNSPGLLGELCSFCFVRAQFEGGRVSELGSIRGSDGLSSFGGRTVGGCHHAI